MNDRFQYNCLLAIDKFTGEIVERYDSIKAVVWFNKDYNYYSLKNAVSKGIPYKGHYYRWQSLER